MNRYYFELLGLVVCLETPVPLTISSKMQPFMCQTPPLAADCRICVTTCKTLPQPEGIWHGPECYLQKGDTLQIFYCNAPQGAPFAVTYGEGKGKIEIAVLPEYVDYFSGISGVLHRIGFENLLLQHNGLLLHASLIKYLEHGIAFTGPSGVGKSTQAKLWQSCFGADILNGDRAALRKTADGWMAYGSPYAGTSGIYKNEHTPLTAIIVLGQAPENRLRPMTNAEAFAALWPELSLRRWDKNLVSGAIELCEQLLKDIPVYLLECVPEESATLLLKKGLSL